MNEFFDFDSFLSTDPTASQPLIAQDAGHNLAGLDDFSTDWMTYPLNPGIFSPVSLPESGTQGEGAREG